MTDKLPRRTGGDGDGPAETPTERLLREAMTARASMVTAAGLRPAAPPKSRIRRLRPVYAVALPLGLAAALALGVLTFHGEPVAQDEVPPPAATLTSAPSPTSDPTGAPSPTAAPTDPGAPTGGAETEAPLADGAPSSSATNTPGGAASSYTFRGVRFKVPAGWKVVPRSDDRVCVLSPGAPVGPQQGWSPMDCEPYGVLVVVYNSPDELGAWPTMADLAADSGWGHQPNCPVWGRPYFPDNGYSSVSAPVRTKPTVAGKTIDKTQWNVACKPGDTFTAQMWGMGSDQVFVVANGLKSDYQAGLTAIVNSLDASGHKAPTSPPSPPSENSVAVSFSGLSTGQQVPANGTPVTFSVTFKNTAQSGFAAVQPALYTVSYPASFGTSEPANAGTLERLDGDTWVSVPLLSLAERNSLSAGKRVTFPLAAGQSKVVKYRITLGSGYAAGTMSVQADVVLPYDGTGASPTHLGSRSIGTTVVK
ncbi:hypothetical protein [Streptomyces sp. LS1784]|uniref:hypothetical protein n=1 Tax=Streptomyces sp. LS1784 TaxID=2851533 RepID=UPI001CCD9D2F|nr:hypothetical protein [Streptomyces sp. LS1784]